MRHLAFAAALLAALPLRAAHADGAAADEADADVDRFVDEPPGPAAASPPAPVVFERVPILTPPPARPKPPYSYHFEQRPRWGLVSAGISVTTIWWIFMFAGAAGGANPAIAVPVIGPFIGAASVSRNELFAGLAVGFYVVDGLFQVLGAALIAGGACARKTVRVRDQVTLIPTVGAGYGGLAAAGRF